MMRWLIALVVVLLIVAVPVVTTYNRIVTMRERVKEKWAQVESQLQRRLDLIPNLVNTAKGYMKHEREVFLKIAEARSKLMGARTREEQIEGSLMLESALGRLLAIVENYPELKANETFLTLMDELAGTENRINVARMRYNDAVRDYNAYIKRFPARIVAGWFGFGEEPYFKAKEEAKEAPKVEFE
jgi:LemA protein